MSPVLLAQRNRVPLINGTTPDGRKRFTLQGHMQPRATAENDLGPAESALTLRNLTLVLQPSAAQQTALEDLLARQQNPSSPDYRRWLTPEEYADRFGFSTADLARITTWLQAQGLTVTSTARGRNAISLSGPVRQVERVFQTEIHRYRVNGELHFANSTEPSLPAALSGMVMAVHGLHDFNPKTRAVKYSPAWTSGVTGNHFLVPDDIAAIYNVKPLYNTGVDGTGQKIAIVGQTRINLSDIQQFRSAYNLPASDPQLVLVPGLPDPGFTTGDLDEASLDIEWSGAVAPKAGIIYVYSADVTDALFYVIDNNLAPVVSMSYGLCEAAIGTADLTTLRQYAKRGNLQGITWLAASGDNGGADCFGDTSGLGPTLAVDAPASLPEVTGVGGTEFNEGSGTFWNTTNSSNSASAVGYIPEMVWNDSVAGTPAAGGGGASAYFPKPDWQTGPGVPNDSARDVPDISFAASADHDGYLFFSGGSRGAVGGTSVSTPVFAGMMALLNQYQVANGFQTAAGLGNINPQLYSMAQTVPGAFHDVTVGDNIVTPCAPQVRNCTALPVGSKAGPGYDTASGLGSANAFNLVTGWNLRGTTKAAVSLSVTSSVVSISQLGSALLTVMVSAGTGAVPTGIITWSLAGTKLGSASLAGAAGKAMAVFTVEGAALPAGDLLVSAVYSGDTTFAAAAGTVSLTVLPSTPLTITGATNAASFRQVYAPGMILAIFGTGLAGTTRSTPFVPLPVQLSGVTVTLGGYLCPLYFISPGQLNIQVPYPVPTGAAVLKVSYNGQSATSNVTVTSTAPGIFADAAGAVVPVSTAKRGDIVTLYITGEGAVTPAPVTGATPTTAAIPRPVQSVGLTVGGAAAGISFVGIPSWAIGVTQINYTVPITAPLGKQQVVVTIGGVATAPATLTVQ